MNCMSTIFIWCIIWKLIFIHSGGNLVQTNCNITMKYRYLRLVIHIGKIVVYYFDEESEKGNSKSFLKIIYYGKIDSGLVAIFDS